MSLRYMYRSVPYLVETFKTYFLPEIHETKQEVKGSQMY